MVPNWYNLGLDVVLKASSLGLCLDVRFQGSGLGLQGSGLDSVSAAVG